MNTPRALNYIGLRIVIYFITLGIIAVLGSFIAKAYYTDIEGIGANESVSERVMRDRPTAPGTDKAIWAKHQNKCWRFEAKGEVTGALLRVHPNDPFIYTRDTTLIGRAIDQAVNGTSEGIDRVFAFCTDTITEKDGQ